MYSTTKELTATAQANLDRSFVLANAALASAERLTNLNLDTAHSILNDVLANTKALLSAKDAQELVSQQAAMVQPATEKAADYSRSILGIASQTNKEVSALIKAQFAEVSKGVIARLDDAIKKPSSGLDAAVAASDSRRKTVEQEVEAAEADLAAATRATSKAVRAPKAKNVAA